MDPRTRASLDELRAIGSKLGLDPEIQERAADLLMGYLRDRPMSTLARPLMAAASVYMSSIMWGKPVSQAAVARAIGVSPTTLNRAYRKMAAVLLPNAGECCTRKGGGRGVAAKAG